jgi:hypothetical protein
MNLEYTHERRLRAVTGAARVIAARADCDQIAIREDRFRFAD